MPFLRRHKFAILALCLYWPLLFTMTHIPIPDYVRRAGVSDKTLHFLAYLVLTLFVWVTVSPFKKVHWLRLPVWLVIVGLAVYGAVDEISQSYFGRGTNIYDYAANMVGVFTSLTILSLVSFWPGSLVVVGIILYILPNFSAGNMICQNPLLNAAFHFGGFAVFTMIWVQVIHKILSVERNNVKWFFAVVLLPLFLLGAAKLTTVVFTEKQIWLVDFLTAVAGIAVVIIVSWPLELLRSWFIEYRKDNAVYKY